MYNLYNAIDFQDSYNSHYNYKATKRELAALDGFYTPNVDRELSICEKLEKNLKRKAK